MYLEVYEENPKLWLQIGICETVLLLPYYGMMIIDLQVTFFFFSHERSSLLCREHRISADTRMIRYKILRKYDIHIIIKIR
ncbi:hypothetical protein Hanom_Chr15g01378961 [Helianthus anomalus]